jgi:hypothetical protein
VEFHEIKHCQKTLHKIKKTPLCLGTIFAEFQWELNVSNNSKVCNREKRRKEEEIIRLASMLIDIIFYRAKFNQI